MQKLVLDISDIKTQRRRVHTYVEVVTKESAEKVRT